MAGSEPDSRRRAAVWASALTLASWVVSAAAFLLVLRLHERGPGGTGAVVRYFAVIGSLAVSLVLSTRNLSPGGAVADLVFLGVPLLGLASFFTVPEIGYGGQLLGFATKSVVVTVLTAVAFSIGLRKLSRPARLRGERVLVAAQALAAMGAILLFGGASFLPSVQQHGFRAAECRTVALDRGPLSYPLVEHGQVYLMGGSGWLYVVSLNPPGVAAKVRIPKPTPEEAGFPGFVAAPGEEAARPEWGVVARTGATGPGGPAAGPGALLLAYPYNIGKGSADGAGGYSYGAVGEWRLEAVVDLGARAVTSWKVTEGSLDTDVYLYPHPVEIGLFRAVWANYGDSLHVTGAGVDTRVWTRGQVRWLVTSEQPSEELGAGRSIILAGTDKGYLYVILLPLPDEDEEASAAGR